MKLDLLILILIWLHTLACFFMTGLIWLIQLVHYPSFKWVAKDNFLAFVNFHARKISKIVMPVMLVELCSLFCIWYFLSTGNGTIGWSKHWIINSGALVGIWLATIFISMPYHQALSKKYDEQIINKLINTNWIRTLSWSIRSLILAFVLFQNTLIREF